MKVADTSALYALFNDLDPHHTAARAQVAQEHGLVVPAEIWSETMCLIQYRMGHEVARAAADFLRAHAQIEIEPTPDDVWDNLSQRADDLHGANPKLSYADSIVAAWCRRRELEPLAFDDELIAACR